MITFQTANPNREYSFPEAGKLPAAFYELNSYIKSYGECINSRTGRTKEVFGTSIRLELEDISQVIAYYTNFVKNRGNLTNPFPFIDPEQYSADLISGEPIPAFNAPGHPGYGVSIQALSGIIDMLKADPTSRRAIYVISNETCFTSWQLLIRERKLQMILSARSCHLNNGFPLDVIFWARNVFYPAADALGIPPDGMTFNIGSLHIG